MNKIINWLRNFARPTWTLGQAMDAIVEGGATLDEIIEVAIARKLTDFDCHYWHEGTLEVRLRISGEEMRISVYPRDKKE